MSESQNDVIQAPTIGRIIYYYREGFTGAEKPSAAIVADVHSDRMVSLGVFDHKGNSRPVVDVYFHHGDGPDPEAHCRWMPYQRQLQLQAGAATGIASGESAAGAGGGTASTGVSRPANGAAKGASS